MRTSWLLVILAVAGCEPGQGTVGPQGPEGPVGPPGATGPRGDPGGVYAWVDADGKEVDTDSSLVWTDVNGWQWSINPLTANAFHTHEATGGYYENTDCSGAWYTSGSFYPRRPIHRDDNTYWVRGDADVPQTVAARSSRGSSTDECRLTPPGYTIRAYAPIKIDGLAPPTLPYRAPLRLQRR